MYYIHGEVVGGYVRIVITFSFDRDVTDIDCLLRAELQTAQTADARGAENGKAFAHFYVVFRANLFTGTAADAS